MGEKVEEAASTGSSSSVHDEREWQRPNDDDDVIDAAGDLDHEDVEKTVPGHEFDMELVSIQTCCPVGHTTTLN
jgi:hypothetical protein